MRVSVSLERQLGETHFIVSMVVLLKCYLSAVGSSVLSILEIAEYSVVCIEQ